MIPTVSASNIYSILGNNSSLVPLAIKDIANSCGLTTASYLAGDKVEGKDRFIDEFGTQAIWLWGIPAYKKILDSTLFKAMGLDPNVDVRLLKDKNILELAQKYAPSDAIKQSIAKAAKQPTKLKALTITKFALSTLMTIGTYFGLTKFRHNYTEKQIEKDYYKNHPKNNKVTQKNQPITFEAFKNQNTNNKTTSNSPSFGGIQDFIFDPVKNLMIVDGSITSERLIHARNPQDFMGYVIKEGSFWAFMYGAGPLLAKFLEKKAETKYNKNISLDARVIESDLLKNSMKDGTLEKHLEEFKQLVKENSKLYEFAVNPDTKNSIIKFAKMSDIISLLKDSDKVDTRKYINLDELKKIADNVENLLTQQKSSNQTIEEFLKSVKHLKRASVITNIGACIGALGIIAPSIMLFMRKFNPEYQVKADIEKKLNEQA